MSSVVGAPRGLRSYHASLDEGIARGLAVARRQVTGAASQAEVWSGQAEEAPYFDRHIQEYDAAGLDNNGLRRDLGEAVRVATEAYGEMARYLRESYLPSAAARDAVGRDGCRTCRTAPSPNWTGCTSTFRGRSNASRR